MEFTQFNTRLIPILFGFGIMILFLIVSYMIKRYKLQKIKNDFTISGNIGETLLHHSDCLKIKRSFCLYHMTLIPMIVCGVIFYSYFYVSKGWLTIENLAFITIGLYLVFYFLFKLIRMAILKKNLQRSYKGDLNTGQELQKLMPHGYHVFHNFDAGKFIIDHIIICPKGVFTVKTNALLKPPSQVRADECTVEYNGHVLHFPKQTDNKTVGQAQEQADWLSNWLSESVREPLAARAIVSIPGWLIKRTTREGIPVVNPGQFDSLFEHIKPRPLEPNIIQEMVNQIKQKYKPQSVTEVLQGKV